MVWICPPFRISIAEPLSLNGSGKLLGIHSEDRYSYRSVGDKVLRRRCFVFGSVCDFDEVVCWWFVVISGMEGSEMDSGMTGLTDPMIGTIDDDSVVE